MTTLIQYAATVVGLTYSVYEKHHGPCTSVLATRVKMGTELRIEFRLLLHNLVGRTHWLWRTGVTAPVCTEI